jgi:DNA modification methylase
MSVQIYQGNCLEVLKTLPPESVQMVVTSPPYLGLRNYGIEGQFGLESSPDCGRHGLVKLRTDLEQDWLFYAMYQLQNAGLDTMCRPEQVPADISECFEPAECGECYVCKLVAVFREVRRILRNDGTVLLNLGDSYAATHQGRQGTSHSDSFHSTGQAYIDNVTGTRREKEIPDGLKPKDLIGIPWRTALALQADGWYLRSDIIWHKTNSMPESVIDRPTKSHEYLFLLAKSEKYFYDAEAVKEQSSSNPVSSARRKRKDFSTVGTKELQGSVYGQSGKGLNSENKGETRNRRSVWTIPTKSFRGCHFATFPPALVEPCILAGTSEKGCCIKCGAPWKRILERGEPIRIREGSDTSAAAAQEEATGRHGDNSIFKTGCKAAMKTIGWEPTCSCGSQEVVPCTILDCFGGAGTTGLVADQLGRDAILIELNPEYCAMAEKRINDAATAREAKEPASV